MEKITCASVSPATGDFVYPVIKHFNNPTAKNGYEEKQLNMKEYNMICSNGDYVVFRVDTNFPYQVQFLQVRKNNNKRVYTTERYSYKYIPAMIEAANNIARRT